MVCLRKSRQGGAKLGLYPMPWMSNILLSPSGGCEGLWLGFFWPSSGKSEHFNEEGKLHCGCMQSCCQCVPASRGFLLWGVSISDYVQGCPLWGHATPALAECKILKLWHWGKRQAACLDFYFSYPLGFSCLLAHCQGLSAGRWVLCVPCLAWLIGTTSPFFQQGDHGQ